MSNESSVMASSVRAAVDHDGETVTLPSGVETAEDFLSWARSEPHLYVSESDLEQAMLHPNRPIKAAANPRVIAGDNRVALYKEPKPVHDLAVTDDMVRAVCKTLRDRKGVTDIAMAGHVLNSMQSEIRKIFPLEAENYTREVLAEAVRNTMPGYHEAMGSLGMAKKVELAAYYLFMAGDITSKDARIIRAAANDLHKLGAFKFAEDN